MTTVELLKTFLNVYFTEHIPEKGLALVTDDFRGYGFADDKELTGIADLKKMAVSDMYSKFMDSELKIEKEDQIAEESAVLLYSLSFNSATVRGRIVGNSRQTPEGRRLFLIVNTMLNPLQTLHVYEDIARIKRIELARELLAAYIPGGMMGGYMEPEFPFYFINDNMLRYLGYESEEDFIQNTQGLIENCIYKDDRSAVDKAVAKQILDTGKYEIDYRMLKKDGSFIWVHDVGKKIVAEDGRDAIVSACYDVTSDKEHERFLEELVSSLNGYLALLAVDMKQKRTIPVYVSGQLGIDKNGDEEEYLARYYKNGMDYIFDGDKERVWNAICDAVSGDASPSISIRSLDRQGKAHWVNASFVRHGTHNGLPAVLTLFTTGTIQNDLQRHALSQNGTGIAVIDANTHEIYFVNDAMFQLLGKEPCDYTNRLCPDVLVGCGGSCAECKMHEVQEKAELSQVIESNGKWLSFHGELREWADKSVVSVYATDVTKQYVLSQQLEKEDEQLQGILHNMGCGVCVSEYDKTGKATITYTSDVFLNMCEAGRKTVIATFEENPFYGVVPEDVHIIQETTERLVAEGGTDEITYRFVTFGGNQIWVRAYFTVLKKPDGGCTMYFTCVDVTEKVQLQKQMEDIFENLPGAVGLYRWDGKRFDRLFVGKGFEALFGSGARKLVDSSQGIIFEIVHPDDVQALRTRMLTFLTGEETGGRSYQYRAWNEDKQAYIWVSLHANKVQQSDGSYLVYVVFTNDMEQVALKNQLAATRIAISAAVKYGQLGMWTYDLTTKCILQNMADMGSYGYGSSETYSPELLVSQKVIHAEDAETYLRCYQAIHDGAQNSDCIVRVFDDNSKAYHWLHIYLVRQPDGLHTNPNAVGMSFDIQQEITNYEELSKAQIQLKQEKQVVDDLFENLPGGVVMHSWNGEKLQPLYVSNGFSELYGEDGKAMLERTEGLNFDAVHPDDLPGLQEFILSHIEKTGQLLTYRYRVWNKKKNDYIWIQLTGKVKPQPDGTIITYTNYADVDAEVKAAEAVQKEEKLLETTCRLAHIWMFQYNLRNKGVVISQGLQEDYNLPPTLANYPEDFLVYPVVPEESHELYRQMVRKVDTGENATTEMPVLMSDGTRRHVRFEWYVTRREAGETVEVAGLVVDITKELAERRRNDKERQKLLGGDKKLNAYSITDLQKEIIVEAKDFSLDAGIRGGDTCKEFNAKVAPLLLTEEDRQLFYIIRDPQYAIGKYEAGITAWDVDMRWRKQDGQVYWRRSVYSVIENTNTGTLYLYCYQYDVMEEKVVQALFAGIQENLYLKTAVISLSSEVLYDFEGDAINRRLSAMPYAVARQAYVDKYVIPEDSAMALEQNSLEHIKKQLATGKKDFSYAHRARKDGTLCYYQVRFASVPGQPDVCICVVRDITDLVTEGERKNAELQKALAVANAATKAKSEFLSRMSHEIRTPMNAIMGMTAIAQDNKSDFLQVSDCLSKIDSSSKYLLTLINDILEMSRIESGKMKLSENKFDFAQLMDQIRTVAEPLAKKSEIRLEIANNTESGSYYGDHIRIQQVMINLLGNAIKFTKKSGRVRFAVSAKEETETKTTFEFTIEDTGIGMNEEFMKTMFEPFSQEDSTTTSRYGGSGLGLAISKSLVDAMGGTISAESMVGIGTNFTVRIPLGKAQSAVLLKPEKAKEIPAAEQDAILKGKRVLMAEDHPMNIMIAKKLLVRKGILITVAENGKIAVDIFRSSQENEYDAILMDIRMPVMDGLEATRQIRALDRPDAKVIPIIAMTANALEEDRKNSKAAGMNDHLAKPIEPNKMYQSLAMHIARRNV